MSTKLEIINRAMTLIGGRQIVNLGEGSKEDTVMSILYTTEMSSLLREIHWRFARRRTKIATEGYELLDTLTSVSLIATATTVEAHSFEVNDIITISGVSPADYNGEYAIDTIPNTTSFTFTMLTSDLAAGSGTMIAQHTPGFDFTNSFLLSDASIFENVIAVLDSSKKRVPFQREGSRIYTNVEDFIYVNYIIQMVGKESLLPPEFVEMLSLRLAIGGASLLTGDRSLPAMYKELYLVLKQSVELNEAQSDNPMFSLGDGTNWTSR